MPAIPEGANTVTAEGTDLGAAIAAAAESLGVPAHRVGHKLDLSHFRNAAGRSLPRDSVKIIAWLDESAPEETPAAPAKKKARSSDDERPSSRRDDKRRDDKRRDDDDDRPRRESRGRDDDRPRREPRSRDHDRSRDVPEGSTEASEFSQEWFVTLLDFLGVEAKVTTTGDDDRVRILVEPTAKAGRLIGKRGSTLAAVRHLLGLALEQYGSPVIDVDIEDDHASKKGRDDRKGRDRDDRKGRDRGDRGDRRGRGRGRGRDRDEDEGGRGSGIAPAKLEALAKRAADKALETGKTITINLDLNSYDRRIVHVTVADVDGVTTQSVERDGKKVVQVLPELS